MTTGQISHRVVYIPNCTVYVLLVVGYPGVKLRCKTLFLFGNFNSRSFTSLSVHNSENWLVTICHTRWLFLFLVELFIEPPLNYVHMHMTNVKNNFQSTKISPTVCARACVFRNSPKHNENESAPAAPNWQNGGDNSHIDKLFFFTMLTLRKTTR